MRKVKILVIALAVILLLGVALVLWLPSFVMTGKRQTLEEAMAWQSDHYDTSFYEGLKKTDYTVKGFEDYVLHVELLENQTPSTRYVILSHGYTDNRLGSLKYVPIYLDAGYHCIIYDLRGHGENEKTFTTYGIREAQDLRLLVEDTRKRYPALSVLGLHGESLGAATTITLLKYRPEVDFAVADCGFSDIENVLRGAFRSAHLPGLLVDAADLGAKLRYHCSLKAMRPVDSLDQNEIPVLFLHGTEDSFILPENSLDMYRRTRGDKELRLIPGAGHAQSVLKSPALYRSYVEEFLKRISC